MQPVKNFYYSKELPPEAVALMHVESTPITPADYTDKINTLAGTGQIGPGGLGTHAWPVEANVFPPVALGEPLAVNNDPPDTGQSYEYIVENQFIEVTNKWDGQNTYFYYHQLPVGVTQVSILNEKHEPASVTYLIEGGRPPGISVLIPAAGSGRGDRTVRPRGLAAHLDTAQLWKRNCAPD